MRFMPKERRAQGGQARGSEKEGDTLPARMHAGRTRDPQARDWTELKGAEETDIKIQRQDRETVKT